MVGSRVQKAQRKGQLRGQHRGSSDDRALTHSIRKCLGMRIVVEAPLTGSVTDADSSYSTSAWLATCKHERIKIERALCSGTSRTLQAGMKSPTPTPRASRLHTWQPERKRPQGQWGFSRLIATLAGSAQNGLGPSRMPTPCIPRLHGWPPAIVILRNLGTAAGSTPLMPTPRRPYLHGWQPAGVAFRDLDIQRMV